MIGSRKTSEMGRVRWAVGRRGRGASERDHPWWRARRDEDRNHSIHRQFRLRRPWNAIGSIPMVLTLLVIFCLVLSVWVWIEILWPLP